MRLNLAIRLCLLIVLVVGPAIPAFAVDGVTLIDQNKALMGNATPGDAPGFPVTISVSGSYKLSGNLTMPNIQTHAIVVTANYVTIDLNGFSIVGPLNCVIDGPPECSATGAGVGVNAPELLGTTVQNGNIRGMGGGAVNLGQEAVVQDLRVTLTGAGDGTVPAINVREGVIRRNVVHTNRGTGIMAFGGSLVSQNSVVNNRVGMLIGGDSLVTENTISSNLDYGLTCAVTGRYYTSYSNNIISRNGGSNADDVFWEGAGGCDNVGLNRCSLRSDCQ